MADGMMKYWPVAVVAAGVIASASVDSFRINAHAEEMKDMSESIDENEEAIEEIQRLLIQRQGEQQLQVQRIENQVNSQGLTLQEIKRLIIELQRTNP